MALGAIPAVLECHHVAGDDDYLLKVRTAGTTGLERLVSERLKSIDGVARTRTVVVLSSPIERAFVPDEV
jgi:Lrp/AsnC family leucine-responsive transcriptional regulator